MKHINIFVFSIVSLAICSCSTASYIYPIVDEGLIVGLTEHQLISEDEKKNLLNVTDAFYQQKFVNKGVIDDSSFCGFYEPRWINRDSIIPLFDYGVHDDVYILTFMINGYYIKQFDIDGTLYFDNTNLIFNKEKSHGVVFSDYLIPQVYKDGAIYNIKEAYRDKIIDNKIFRYVEERNEYYIEAKNQNCLFEIDDRYFSNLPSLTNYPDLRVSLLKKDLQDFRSAFYKKTFVDKNIKNDSYFRDLFFYEDNKKYCVEVDEFSIHINNYKSLLDNVKLYTISINDIFRELRKGWLNEPLIHTFTLGDLSIQSDYLIEPIIQIDNDIYYVTDAYSKNKLTKEILEAISLYCGEKGEFLSYYNHEEDFVETKMLERRFQINDITLL